MNARRAKRIFTHNRFCDVLAALLLVTLSITTHAQLPDPGMEITPGRTAALVNFRYIANTVWTTEQAVQKIEASK